MKRRRGTIPTVEELLAKTKANGDCLEWQGSCGAAGLPRISIRGKSQFVTRLMMTLLGQPPGDLIVRHDCDNSRCVNPKHLRLGTYRDNVHDMLQRNRRADFHGEKNGQAYLTNADVHEIRAAYRMGARSKDLMTLYNARPNTIYEILALRRWVSR